MTRTTSIVAALGLGVGSVIGGGLVAGALDNPEDERVLPEREKTIPVLAPTESGTGEAPAPSDGAGAGGGGAVASEVVSEIALTAQQGVGDAAGVPRGTRFVDPCAGESPGAGSGDCPDGGGGTVLASTFDPPPFDIVELRTGPVALATAHCSFDLLALDEPGDTALLVISNNPADFAAFDGPAGSELVQHVPEFSTGASERSRWEAWGEAGTIASDADHLVHTCAALHDVRVDAGAPRAWEVRVDGRFPPDETDSATLGFDAFAETRGRPPVSVRPTDPNHLDVTIPVKPLSEVRFAVIRTPQVDGVPTGPAGSACTAAAGTDLVGVNVRAPEATIPDDELSRPDYPYDPAYTGYITRRTGGIAEGVMHEVCVVWLDAGGTEVERAAIPVIPPNRYGWSVGFGFIGFNPPRAPESVTLDVLRADGSVRCSLTPHAGEPTTIVEVRALPGRCDDDPARLVTDRVTVDFATYFLALRLRHGDLVREFAIAIPARVVEPFRFNSYEVDLNGPGDDTAHIQFTANFFDSDPTPSGGGGSAGGPAWTIGSEVAA